jgi:hypothetical protein
MQGKSPRAMGALAEVDQRKITNRESTNGLTATTNAYERIVDKLHELDLRVRTGYNSSVAQCPSHDDRQASFAVYDKGGKAKVVCFTGCDDELGVLPALGMTVADLYDSPRSGKRHRPDPAGWPGTRHARP